MKMDLIKESYNRLFPYKSFTLESTITYSGHFKGFNAKVQRIGSSLHFKLSKEWQDVNDEIKIGLIQDLLLRILKKEKVKTFNIDLYHNFLKNAHIGVKKDKTHPLLEESFNKLNDKFFFLALEKPNFVLSTGLQTLGSYHYGTDTITITEHLLQDSELLDYVMFHEMLHKKHKFSSSKERTRHHSTDFRKEENSYPNHEELEKRLQKLISSKKRKSFLRWWR